jgi:hypothetical protein
MMGSTLRSNAIAVQILGPVTARTFSTESNNQVGAQFTCAPTFCGNRFFHGCGLLCSHLQALKQNIRRVCDIIPEKVLSDDASPLATRQVRRGAR